jgi:hypothetical protein
LEELNGLLWIESDHVAVRELWKNLCFYCYLPRLASEEVLLEAIRDGVNSEEFFAYASCFVDNRYVDLKYNQRVGVVDRSGYLVKVEVAKKRLAEEAERRRAEETRETVGGGSSVGGAVDGSLTGSRSPVGESGGRKGGESPAIERSKNKRFYMSAKLDVTRAPRDMREFLEEVINHLTSVDGAQVEISLEVSATSPDGFQSDVVRTVSENCQTLKARTFGFEE